MNDIVFAIDPGSIKTGWAVLESPDRLIEAGLLLPDKRAAAAEFRIDSMCQDLLQLLDKHRPETILIEWTSGHVGHKRHHGGGAGLAIYGISVGALWREVINWRRSLPTNDGIEVEIILVPENKWTRSVPKVDRQAAIADIFPEYQIKQDTGGDIADALGLAIWYLRRKIINLVEAIK